MGIFEAIEEGNINQIKRLIKHYQSDIYMKNELGNTTLHYAARSGKIEAMQLLLDNGAKSDINAVDNFGNTVLHKAARSGNKEAMQLLLDNGAKSDINAVSELGNTVLHKAARSGNKEAMQLLLDNGAKSDINAVSELGNTVLHKAARSGNKEAMQLLLDNGAKSDINAVNEFGNTVLHEAACSGNKEAIQLLLDNGAKSNINAISKGGNTVLDYAIEFGNVEIIQLLLDNGANIKNDHDSNLYSKTSIQSNIHLGFAKFYMFIKSAIISEFPNNKFSELYNKIIRDRSFDKISIIETRTLLKGNTGIEEFDKILGDKNVISYIESQIRNKKQKFIEKESISSLVNVMPHDVAEYIWNKFCEPSIETINRTIDQSHIISKDVRSFVAEYNNIINELKKDEKDMMKELYKLVKLKLPAIDKLSSHDFNILKDTTIKICDVLIEYNSNCEHKATGKIIEETIQEIKNKFNGVKSHNCLLF